MTELNEPRLLASFAREQQTSPASEATKLDLVADQLVSIARNLRGEGMLDAPGPRRVEDRGHTPSVNRGTIDPAHLRRMNAEAAREIYASRRSRDGIFGNPELFGEPAWDILLDLYVADVEGKAVSVSSACIGSAAPPTTGLRWLGVLAEQGLVLREHDPEDQRRVLVRLTERGLAAMDEYFAAAAGPA